LFYASPHVEGEITEILTLNGLIRWQVTQFENVHDLQYAIEKANYDIDVIVTHWHGRDDPDRDTLTLIDEAKRKAADLIPEEDNEWEREMWADKYLMEERRRRKAHPPHDWDGENLKPRSRIDWYFPRNLVHDWQLGIGRFEGRRKPLFVAEFLKDDTRFAWEIPQFAKQSAYGMAVIGDMLRSGFDMVYRYRGRKYLDELVWNIGIAMFNLAEEKKEELLVSFDPWFDGFLCGETAVVVLRR
jgi:hypothetical protein